MEVCGEGLKVASIGGEESIASNESQVQVKPNIRGELLPYKEREVERPYKYQGSENWYSLIKHRLSEI